LVKLYGIGSFYQKCPPLTQKPLQNFDKLMTDLGSPPRIAFGQNTCFTDPKNGSWDLRMQVRVNGKATESDGMRLRVG
jgi:hypothetical protein